MIKPLMAEKNILQAIDQAKDVKALIMSDKRSIDRASRYKQSAQYREDIKRRKKASIQKSRQWMLDYYRCHPCVYCGEADPIVLECNHIDPNNKNEEIARMVSKGCSVARLEKELLLCEICCANCHRRITGKQSNWYAGLE